MPPPERAWNSPVMARLSGGWGRLLLQPGLDRGLGGELSFDGPLSVLQLEVVKQCDALVTRVGQHQKTTGYLPACDVHDGLLGNAAAFVKGERTIGAVSSPG